MKRFILGLLAGTLAGSFLLAESPPRWTKVATPQLAIYTANSVPEAREWLASVETFRQLMSRLGPTDDRALDPMIAVVFRNEDDFEEIFPHPADAKFLSLTFTYLVAGKTFQKFGRTFIGVNPRHEDLARPAFFLQAGLWATQPLPRSLPLWLTMGLQEICVEGVTRRDGVEFGVYSKVNKDRLRGKVTLPLDQLFSRRTTDFDGYAESWALVHYLLWGDNGANRPALLRYIEAWEGGRSHQDAFAAAFPRGLDDLAARFAQYVNSGSYHGELIAFPAAAAEAIQVTPATEAEVQVALGYMCIVAGTPSLATDHFDRAAAAAPGSVAVLEARGYQALEQENSSGATDFFRQAVAVGSHWYFAHAQAVLVLGRPVLGSELLTDHSNPARARQTADALQELMRWNPYYYPSYEWYAGVIGALGEVTDADAQVLARGQRLYPDVPGLELGQVAFELKRGQLDAARTRMERLKSGTVPIANNLVGYADKLDARIRAGVELARARRSFDEGRPDEAQAAVEAIPRPSLTPEELKEVQEIEQRLESFANIHAAIGKKRYGTATALIESALQDDPPEKIRAQLNALAAEVAAARKQQTPTPP